MKARLPHSKFSILRVTEWTGFYLVLLLILALAGLWASKKIIDHDLPPGKIILTTAKTNYIVGDSIEFSLVNNFPTKIYVNNGCPGEPLSVYKWDDQRWIRIHDTANEGDCDQQQRMVAVGPNGTITGNYDIWKKLFSTPGMYRLVATIEHYESLPYVDFVIRAPASTKSTVPKNTPASPAPQIEIVPDTRTRERDHGTTDDD